MFLAVLCTFDYLTQLGIYASKGNANLVGHKAVVLFDTLEKAIKFAENYGVQWECFDENLNVYMWYTKYVIVEPCRG